MIGDLVAVHRRERSIGTRWTYRSQYEEEAEQFSSSCRASMPYLGTYKR